MDRVTAKLRSFSKTEENDGFKFAVTLIVAFSTVSYKIYYYVENNPVSDFWYNLLNIFIPIFLIVLCLIVYIIIKGIALEIGNNQAKGKFKFLASSIYISTFRWFFVFIIAMPILQAFIIISNKIALYINNKVLVYIEVLLFALILTYSILKVLQVKNYFEKGSFWKNCLNLKELIRLTSGKFSSEESRFSFIMNYVYSFHAILLSFLYVLTEVASEVIEIKISEGTFFRLIRYLILLLLYFPLRYIVQKIQGAIFGEYLEKMYGGKANSYILIVVCLIIIFGGYITPYILTGNIEVEINDNYFEKEGQIPINIINTGYNENLTINLSKTTFEGDTSILDSIEVHPTKNVNEIVTGKYLRSSTLDYGVYKLYINTTGLTQGYYELSVSENAKGEMPFPVMKRTFNSFYLDKG